MKKIIILVSFICLGNASAAPSSTQTSVDLYCDTMVLAAIETGVHLASKTGAKDKNKKVEEIESEMLKLCKATPATGESKLVSKMTPQEISIVSCVAMAEGIYIAYITDQESYPKLKRRREFASNACISNSKAFLSDIYKHGPDYAMAKKY